MPNLGRPPRMTAARLAAAALLFLQALACCKATQPCSTAPDEQRRLRTARLEQGLAEHKKLLPWLHALPERWSTGYSKVEKQLFLDAAADCVTEQRIGAAGDGGKRLCNAYRLAPPCVVYGIGAGPEISFEKAMAADFGCEVHTFDPSQAMKLVLDGVPSDVKTLADMAKLLGHTKVDVLKIDVEGGELSALPEMLKGGTLKELQVKQLLIEFHALDLSKFDRFVTVVDSLEDAGYILFRKELNSYAPETTGEYAFAERAYLLD